MKNSKDRTGTRAIQETVGVAANHSALVEVGEGRSRHVLLTALVDAVIRQHPACRLLVVTATDESAKSAGTGAPGALLPRNGTDPGTAVVFGSIDAIATGVAANHLDTRLFDRVILAELDSMAGAADVVLVRRALGAQRESRLVTAIATRTGPAHRTLMRELSGQYEEVAFSEETGREPAPAKQGGIERKGKERGRENASTHEPRNGSSGTYDGRNIRSIQDSIAAITGGLPLEAEKAGKKPDKGSKTGRKAERRAGATATPSTAPAPVRSGGKSSGKNGRDRSRGKGQRGPAVRTGAEPGVADPYSMTTEERLRLYRERYGIEQAPAPKKDKAGKATRRKAGRVKGGDGSQREHASNTRSATRPANGSRASPEIAESVPSAAVSSRAFNQEGGLASGERRPGMSILSTLRNLGLFRKKPDDQA